MALIVGDADTTYQDPDYRPITYPTNNRMTNVSIADNSIQGGHAGINLSLGSQGAEGNEISQASISGNVIADTGSGNLPAFGISLSGGGWSGGRILPEGFAHRGQDMVNIVVTANSVRLAPQASLLGGGIVIIGGESGQRSTRIRDVLLSRNEIDGGGLIGILVLGGWGNTTRENSISRLDIGSNKVLSRPSLLESYSVKGISLIGGLEKGTYNRVDDIRLDDNLVAGIRDDVSIQNNVGNGASGNVVQLVTSTQPKK